ncbi:uncharacterized protein CLUP02_17377 [Colletotrichum lupini]|uniref:Uncharacterized protein n=1 Tax=Colletotrichum lupini TaxID=145971 RepID=A0A9Q8SF12_9PEZI|nr:uncharacterized protein CLUP02_17377 [Colletotrichum lupini]UQC75868.1 hypothetical protein CLUP02_17377 [Colletotrichum lupini]
MGQGAWTAQNVTDRETLNGGYIVKSNAFDGPKIENTLDFFFAHQMDKRVLAVTRQLSLSLGRSRRAAEPDASIRLDTLENAHSRAPMRHFAVFVITPAYIPQEALQVTDSRRRGPCHCDYSQIEHTLGPDSRKNLADRYWKANHASCKHTHPYLHNPRFAGSDTLCYCTILNLGNHAFRNLGDHPLQTMDKLLQECLVVCDCENDAASLIDVIKDHLLRCSVMPKHISACSVATGREYRRKTLFHLRFSGRPLFPVVARVVGIRERVVFSSKSNGMQEQAPAPGQRGRAPKSEVLSADRIEHTTP